MADQDENAREAAARPAAGERLQKVLARAGVASRRAAEAMIAAGRVAVNGRPVTEPGVRVDPERDRVTVDGRPVGAPEAPVYLLLHKPAGYVTTAHDELDRPTVLDLVPAAPRVYPVGRLDADTEGLLLLTNDGDLALRLTHPRHEVAKTYRALVQGIPSAAALDHLRAGVEIEGRRTLPARVEPVVAQADTAELLITIREGRKRQVRLMGAAVGHQVLRLRRERLGSLDLGDLPVGRWRRLTSAEVARLRRDTEPDRPAATATPTAPDRRRQREPERPAGPPDTGPRAAAAAPTRRANRPLSQR